MYLNNIQELMENLKHEHNPISSKVSLKTVLLHIGKRFPSLPMIQIVHKKNRTITFRFCCQKYATENTGGIQVLN
jgi:hypothetical protein